MKTTLAKMPDSVRRLVAAMGCTKRYVNVSFSETFRIPSAYGDGYRAVWGTTRLDGSTEGRIVRGSWGGPNPFARGLERATNDAEGGDLPMVSGTIAVAWQQGGHGTSIPCVYAHPSDAAPLLPEARA